jgi:hypothetical protein
VLKSRPFAGVARTWSSLIKVFNQAYPGWTPAGGAQWFPITHVFQWRAFFGQIALAGERQAAIRTCLHRGLVGLFGTGKETAADRTKPHRFEIGLDASNVPTVAAYMSSTEGSQVFRDAQSIFQTVPNITSLESHDLEQQWLHDRGAVVASMEAQADLGAANLTRQIVDEYATMSSGFCLAPSAVDMFGPPTAAYVAQQQAIGGPTPRGRQGGQRHTGDSDDGDAMVDDMLRDQSSDEEDVGADDPEEEEDAYEVEAIRECMFDREHQMRRFLVKYVGYDAEEWVWDINMDPGPVYDEFMQRQQGEGRDRRSEITKRSFREIQEAHAEPLGHLACPNASKGCDKTSLKNQRGVAQHLKFCKYK